MRHVIEINRIDDLESFRRCWQSLLQRTRGASFFQSLDWLEVYWRHFGASQKLRVLVVLGQEAPIGILPLTVMRERTRIGHVRVLTYPLHDWATFYGPIGPDSTTILSAGMRHVSSTDRDWDMLDLRFTNRELDCGRTPLAMQAAGFRAREGVWATTHVIQLEGRWSDYVAARTGKFRNNIRRAETRAARLGEVTFERYRPRGDAQADGDPRWDLYDECLELAERSWQGSSMDGTTLSHDSVKEFFRDLHAVAARCGAVDLNALRINRRMVAFAYNYHYAGSLAGVRTGYAPEFAHISPGTLLLASLIRDSFSRGDKTLDLGTNPAPYKRHWRTHTLASCRYTHYAAGSPRSQLLRLKNRLWPRTAERAAIRAADTVPLTR